MSSRHPVASRSIDPWVGHQVGDYVIDRKLGQGGMGSVYAAHHAIITKKRAAIKVLNADIQGRYDLQERFLREARAIGEITHPNVVGMFDFKLLQAPGGGEVLCLFMEYLEGESLADYLERHPRPELSEVHTIMRDVCRGIAAAHGMGLIHRDLKPDNIFLARVTGGDRVTKVLDFGLARSMLQSMHNAKITADSSVLGTVYYMSAEQAMGKPVDVQADIYALGVILYEMAAGRMPFDGENPTVIMAKIVNTAERAIAPRTLETTVPPGIEQICAKAMARDCRVRYSSVNQMAEDLEAVSRGKSPVHASHDTVLAVFRDVTAVSSPGDPRRLVSSVEVRPEVSSAALQGAPTGHDLRERVTSPLPTEVALKRRVQWKATFIALFLALVAILVLNRTHSTTTSPPVRPVPVSRIEPTPVAVPTTPVPQRAAPPEAVPSTTIAPTPSEAHPPVATPPSSRRRHHPRQQRCVPGRRDRHGLIIPCL